MVTETKTLYEEVIIAGFGGQGIILLGKLLAQTAMEAGKEVTYMPAYGAEMRGGTANSMIIISDDPIATPTVSRPDSLIIMNKASMHKFGSRLKSSGLLIYNSSLVEPNDLGKLDSDIEILAIPVDEIAAKLGAIRSANMVALGAYFQKRNLFSSQAAAESLKVVLAKRYHKTLPLNTTALERGYEFAKKSN